MRRPWGTNPIPSRATWCGPWPARSRLDDFVISDGRWRFLGDDAAIVQTADAIDEIHDQIHVVLDNHQRQLRWKTSHNLRHLRSLGGREAGRRLVQQQNSGFTDQRQGQLQLALLAV